VAFTDQSAVGYAGTAEVVNDCETPTCRIYCRASALVGAGLGRLIQAAVVDGFGCPEANPRVVILGVVNFSLTGSLSAPEHRPCSRRREGPHSSRPRALPRAGPAEKGASGR
jgi:hypothetical protein